jgi:aminoglycoside phosphotransferase (APT) family kinase protein
MPRMHDDELEVDEELVRDLVSAQFPEWAELPLRRVEPGGTVNAIFRLGGGLSVRLPRRDGPTSPGPRQPAWLPRVASPLALEVPVPVAQGRPGSRYPWYWEVHTWLEGETAPVSSLDVVAAARDLARLVAALQDVDSAGAPQGRGVPLAELNASFHHWAARLEGPERVRTLWERALAAPPWDGAPVWHHGDLDARNWLVRDGRIACVLDWEDMGAGDPACDVMVAWKLHSPEARDAFRAALDPDDATWERARGWVVWQAVAALAYYTPENNPPLYGEAEAWLDLVLSEDG